jgi:hypothetical protein
VPRTAHLTVLGRSITVTQEATPSFSNLSAPSITYGAATTSIAGTLGTDAPYPTGSVTITLGGVSQPAALQSDGSFAASFDTHALAVTAGGYPISFSYLGDSGYGPATGSSTLTVTPATLTVTANDAARSYGAANPTFTFGITGFVNHDPASVVSGTPGLSTVATAASAPNTYAITVDVSPLAAANYTFQAVSGTLTVNAAPLSASGVNFNATAGAPFSGAVATFTNADPFGGAGSYSAQITWGDGSTSAGTISGTGSTLTVSGSHTYADPVNRTVQVTISHNQGYTTTAMPTATATVTSLGQGVGHGLTGGIGFWHNSNGQALISSFNGGATATALANWLAATFPNLYGVNAGDNDLTGRSNAQVAAFYLSQFGLPGPKVEAQVLAVALNVYATTASLGGSAGGAYGFTVSATGLGARSYNVGGDGAAFGVANNTTRNVYQLLWAVNARAVRGLLYNGDATLRQQAADLCDALNTAGGI